MRKRSARRVRIDNLQAERLGDRGNWGELSQRIGFVLFFCFVFCGDCSSTSRGGLKVAGRVFWIFQIFLVFLIEKKRARTEN